MCTINIIAAKSLNGVIGKNNQLPWHLPSDLKHFRNLTQGKIVIMGRKTYESIGKPLPNRRNIVISSNRALKLPEGVTVCQDPQEALKAARVLAMTHDIDEAFVIGGTSVYQSFVKRSDKMYLTVIQRECIGDTVFPFFKPVFWSKEKVTEHYDSDGYMLDNPNDKGLQYVIEEYERIM